MKIKCTINHVWIIPFVLVISLFMYIYNNDNIFIYSSKNELRGVFFVSIIAETGLQILGISGIIYLYTNILLKFINLNKKKLFVLSVFLHSFLLEYYIHAINDKVHYKNPLLIILENYLSKNILIYIIIFACLTVNTAYIKKLYKRRKLRIKKVKNTLKNKETNLKNQKEYTEIIDNLKQNEIKKTNKKDTKYQIPHIENLNFSPKKNNSNTNIQSKKLNNVLITFGIKGNITNAYSGPLITIYDFNPESGTRISKIQSVSQDIARSMEAPSARVISKKNSSLVEIEIPNLYRKNVYAGDIISSKEFKNTNIAIPLGIGVTVHGKPLVFDLTQAPHLLVAGTTGSGKSVGIASIITSIIYRLSPEECQIILIDPKMLEFVLYEKIPHLLCPVITNHKKVVPILQFLIKEMEDRYKKMAEMQVRNISSYNKKSRKKMPFIVAIIDEFSDLMITSGQEIESCIQRLAQMARASGIHIIIATQRPSVDVITGTIKANFPSRISYQVSSKIDSRTIIGEHGAENLLGKGDFLFSRNGRMIRGHTPFISENEIEKIVNFISSSDGNHFDEDIIQKIKKQNASFNKENLTKQKIDARFNEAVEIVKRDRKASTTYIQTKMRIGYVRAASITQLMEEKGIIGTPYRGKREVLIK